MNQEPFISLTPSAMAHIQKWIIKEQACGLRLSVKKTGCSGFSYVTELVKEINPLDTKVEISTPFDQIITVLIDASSISYLKGICLDFAKPTEGGGLQGAKLVFINPNQTGVCGCGESFSVE